MARNENGLPGRVRRAWGILAAALGVMLAVGLSSCGNGGKKDGDKGKAGTQPAATQPAATPVVQKGEWRDLFDGKTLKGWIIPEWGGSGKVYVKDGVVHMEAGESGTGITYQGPVPRDNYEIQLEGMRVDGFDFFCGLTFPVGKDPMSLILGGWGGSLVGLSSINGADASENETTQVVNFDQKKWYPVRLRVTTEKIRVWLDGKKIIDVPRKNRKISIRMEVEQSVPLGICTWVTHGAARGIRIRTLRDDELQDNEPAKDEP